MAKSKEQYIAERTDDYELDLYSFSLIDENTVKRLRRDGEIELPAKKINVPKDERWNTKQMGSKLLAGIMNGDSIPKIAQSLGEVIGNNSASAVRNARTMVTSAENHGRLDSYKNLEKQGVVQKKVWMATADDRTRASHIDIDGEEQDLDAPFTNGCMFPADGKAPAEEVWNCRCSMRTHIVGFRKADGSISPVNYERDRTIHNEQMEAEKQRRGIEEKKEPAKQPVVKPKGDEQAYNALVVRANANKVAYNDVAELQKTLTEDEIIDKLAGGDMTKGSCASLALAYCGNKVGFDVTDFRGGNSQALFSRGGWRNAMQVANAQVQQTIVSKEATGVAKIIKNIDMNKEYMLVCGGHASIIRNTSEGLQYLELQSKTKNGWKPFEFTQTYKATKYDFATSKVVEYDKTVKTTVADTLNLRFGCRKTRGGICYLSEVDSFQNTEEFRGALGYINTAIDKQMKGATGGIK